MKKWMGSLFLSLVFSFVVQADDTHYPPVWAYDAGPEVADSQCTAEDTSMGCELVRLKASIPYFPAVDKAVMSQREKGGSNKFRPAYGDIPWRMLQKPNSVKILFIGQDGTHIAEAAGRPATAGFGGRAHDLANYFGVDYSAAFINTYAFTIKGQSSSRNTPYLENGKVKFGNITNNGLWLVSQDKDSPVVKWRNRLIDWIIRNNKQSLKLIVGFGGTARESMATFVESKGGKVGSWYSVDQLANVKVSETKLQFAGGNNQFPVPLDKNGNDLYPQILGYTPDYSTDRNTGQSEGQEAAMKALKSPEALQAVKNNMFISNGGVNGSGILHPAQIGGYSLDKIQIAGNTTRSLKGIELDDGSILNSDILMVQLPHPTYLSNVARRPGGREAVSDQVADAVNVLEPYADAGWIIKKDAFRPELQGKNLFFGPKVNGERQKYTYGRADIGPEYYDFGTPANRMVSVSSAKRLKVPSPVSEKNKGGVIMFGSRDQPYFDKEVIRDMLSQKPNQSLSQADVWTSRPRTPELLTVFDKGPGEKYAKMMKQNLVSQLNKNGLYKPDLSNVDADFADQVLKAHYTKAKEYIVREDLGFNPEGMNSSEKRQKINEWVAGQADEQKITLVKEDYKKFYDTLFDVSNERFNVKSHPDTADYGHYRGTFNKPKVIILADPDGYDSLMTARAATGTRGQYLHGLVKNIMVDGEVVGDNYLVINTVPFGMDNATDANWKSVLKQTQAYRDALFNDLVMNSQDRPALIIADGQYASSELTRMFYGAVSNGDLDTPIVSIDKQGLGNASGMTEAISKIADFDQLDVLASSVSMSNIPRSHLSYYARSWEGTTGDRVITAPRGGNGKVFAMIAPDWAVDQKPEISFTTKAAIKVQQQKLEDHKLPRVGESAQDFLERTGQVSGALAQ